MPFLCYNTDMHKAFRYRLYPTKAQERTLQLTLNTCRWLYNYLLEQRKVAWEERQESLSLYGQLSGIPALKAERPELSVVHSQVLQNVGVRLDLAFQAFFRRVKAGEEPGYPRFKGVGWYDSFCYPQSGVVINGATVALSKIGTIKMVYHRPVDGRIKTTCIKRSGTGKWYVTFSCDVPDVSLPERTERVGIDVGLVSFATLSDGGKVDNPRFFRHEERALKRVNRQHAKLAKGSPKRRKHRKAVARVHERVFFRRHNFVHQESRRIVDTYQVIAVEDLAVNRMVHNHCLAKSISDAGWGMFASVLSSKAASAGRTYVAVNPAYTSQDCSRCHHRQKMPLSDRVYRCPCCGLVMDRDRNAALNILGLGQQALGLAPRSPLF